MLTRLKVTGFKNLVDVDVRFGPFTCIAGANGVGKSNLFDAIRLLSNLADRSLLDAAMSVRDDTGRSADVRQLFLRTGSMRRTKMRFEAEMVVPWEGVDELGQKATATITFLRYAITLGYREGDNTTTSASLQIVEEQLTHINLGEARNHLLFLPSNKWLKSVLRGRRTSPFISTEHAGDNTIIKLHQDGRGGRTLSRLAATLPRTVLSAANASESPTALLARREMQSWRLLQLEPSALRRPDDFTAPTRLGIDGGHLAATLHRLAHAGQQNGDNVATTTQIYGQVTSRLSQLIDDVREVRVDRDEKREILTLQVAGHDGATHPARALSDGTLRFLALAVLDLDPEAQGLLCLEEPENGIHPERIPAMLRLLQDIATDVDEPIGPDNPLRQVIVNTHSPAVVSQVPDDSLLVARLQEKVDAGTRFKHASFGCLADTWRSTAPEKPEEVSRGALLAYLNPVAPLEKEDDTEAPICVSRRVIDRPDIRQIILPLSGLSD
jgi:predicted ATPase